MYYVVYRDEGRCLLAANSLTHPCPPSTLSLSLFALQGTVLIAVNPLRRIPNPDMSEFMDCSLDSEAPHPYAIAEVRHPRRHIPSFPCGTRNTLNVTVGSTHVAMFRRRCLANELSLKESIDLGVYMQPARVFLSCAGMGEHRTTSGTILRCGLFRAPFIYPARWLTR